LQHSSSARVPRASARVNPLANPLSYDPIHRSPARYESGVIHLESDAEINKKQKSIFYRKNSFSQKKSNH